MIIVEGADLTGKTTLTNALVRKLNSIGVPLVPLHLSKLPECFDHFAGYLPLMSRDVVWDRFYMSRQAYGEAIDNQRVLTPVEYSLLDAHARLHCGFTVLLVAEPEVIRSRWRDGEHLDYDLTQVLDVNEKYREFIDREWMDTDLVIILTSVQPNVTNYVTTVAEKYMTRRLQCLATSKSC